MTESFNPLKNAKVIELPEQLKIDGIPNVTLVGKRNAIVATRRLNKDMIQELAPDEKYDFKSGGLSEGIWMQVVDRSNADSGIVFFSGDDDFIGIGVMPKSSYAVCALAMDIIGMLGFSLENIMSTHLVRCGDGYYIRDNIDLALLYEGINLVTPVHTELPCIATVDTDGFAIKIVPMVAIRNCVHLHSNR